jgi:hypothetical protein
MTYSRRSRSPAGLLGLGTTGVDDQDPVVVGETAQTSPILSSASVMASDIMLRMAAAPRSQRLAKMVEILNAGQPGLGTATKVNFLQRVSVMGPRKKDQAMFDAIRAALADALAKKVLSRGGATSGLGQTIAEAQGRTSQDINDANALFCSYGVGIGAMVGGFAAQFGVGSGASASAGVGGATAAGNMAGCGAGALVIQGQNAQALAQLAQQGTVQTLAMQQAQDARFVRYALVGGGLIGLMGIGLMVMKKKS